MKEQKVRIHYSFGPGTDIAIVPINKIMDYVKKFTIISIEPHETNVVNKCRWQFYDEEEYYETECSNSIEKEDVDDICPSHCPYCGETIEFTE